MPSATRGAFGAGIPKLAKRSAGRTSTPATPLNVRTFGVPLSEDNAAYVRAKLGARLGKFALHIERISVRFEDTNGPRGGDDTRCRIKVTLSGLPSVVVEEQAIDALQAFDAAGHVVERAVKAELAKARIETRRDAPPR